MAQLAKAVLAREVGKPVVVEEIEVAAPQHGEVTMRIAACGVCHSDLSATNGTINYPMPLILGHEGAGVIVAVGDGVDNYAVGDHVVSSFVSMCGHCHYCQTGRPQLCVQSLKSLFTLPDGTVRTRDSAG
jgi:Zn-dependent alcohol dehydrogenase